MLVRTEDFYAALRLRWFSAMNVVALGLVLAGAFALFAPVQYRSQVVLYGVAVNRQITSSDLLNSAMMAQKRMPVYVELLRTPQVLEPALTKLGLTMSVSDLAESLTVTQEEDTAVMSISVLEGSPAGAKGLADSVAASLIEAVRQLEGGDTDSGAVELRVVSEGSYPTLPAGPRRPLNLLVGLCAGLLAALAIVGLTGFRLYLQRRRTDATWVYIQIDGKTQLVLAHIVDNADGSVAPRQTSVQLAVNSSRFLTPLGVSESAAKVRS